MWKTIADALELDPSYHASYFRRLLDDADGAFEVKARAMLREGLHEGLIHLAKHRDSKALSISMESVILHEPQWHGLFTPEEVNLCKSRLELARAVTKQ